MSTDDETVVDLRKTEIDGEVVDALGTHDTVLAALAKYYESEGHEARQLWVGDLGDPISLIDDLGITGVDAIDLQQEQRVQRRTVSAMAPPMAGPTSAMFDLYVPDFQRLFEVETVDTLISVDPHRYGSWRTAGYEVWVVAPGDHLEQFERRLRHSVDHVVPWRATGSQVVFESPR